MVTSLDRPGLTPDGRQVAYPPCCGQPTRLSVFGWRCAVCGEYTAFAAVGQAQDAGLTSEEGDSEIA